MTLVPKNENDGRFALRNVLQVTVLLSFLLYFGKNLFIPLSIAVLVSCILYPLCAWLERHGAGKTLAIATSLLILLLLISGIVYLAVAQVIRFEDEWSGLKGKLGEALDNLSAWLTAHLGVSHEQQQDWLNGVSGNSRDGFIPFIGTTIYSLSISTVLLVLIPILSALILYYRSTLLKALYLLLPAEHPESLRAILRDTVHTYYNFIKGMIVVYLIVGVLNSIGLLIIGVPYPFVFGFLASIMTFIPYVGIVIASLLPMAISWLEYNSIWYPLGVVAVFTVVQYLEANVIFPFAVSSRLKINALVTIIAIVAGGILWGAAGMVLFIPFLGILKLVADRSPSLKAISVLLGQGDDS
jgi:predicted PurR-regulated permease PerM